MGKGQAARIDGLDGLRGILAWWVVAGHLAQAFGWRLGLVNLNYLAVDVFIFLSGFVIAWLVEMKAEPYRAYILRRAFRLFPVYVAALAAAAILLLSQPAVLDNLPVTPTTLNWQILRQEALADPAPHLAAHVALLQGLIPDAVLPDASYTVLGPAWSISLEWQFYLLAPMLLWLARRRFDLAAALLVIAGFAVSGYFGEGFLGSQLAKFLVGIYSFQAVVRRDVRGAVLTIVAAVWLLATQPVLIVVPLAIWLFVMSTVASPVGSAMRGLGSPLRSRALARLGQCSYSTYLLHMPVLLAAIGLCARMPHFEAGVVGLTVCATLALSLISYAWIEKPGMDLGKVLAGRLGEAERREPVSEIL